MHEASSGERGRHVAVVCDEGVAVQLLGRAMDLEPHRAQHMFR